MPSQNDTGISPQTNFWLKMICCCTPDE